MSCVLTNDFSESEQWYVLRKFIAVVRGEGAGKSLNYFTVAGCGLKAQFHGDDESKPAYTIRLESEDCYAH